MNAVYVRKRLFMIRDRKYRYEVVMNVITPKQEWVASGTNVKIIYSPLSSKTIKNRYRTEAEADEIVAGINGGTRCFKCGHPRNCGKNTLGKHTIE
jgi:hypothetical protein